MQGWRELGRTVTQIDLSLPDQVTALMGQLKTEAQNSLEIWKIRHGVLTFLQCMHECSGMSNSPELTNTILWTVAHQALLSIGFSRQEYWGGLPFPPPGILPDLGIEPMSLISLVLAGRSLPLEPSGKTFMYPDQISRSVMSDSLRSHESQHTGPPCPSPTPGVHSDSRPSSQ